MGSLERTSVAMTWMLALAAYISVASCSDPSSRASADAAVPDSGTLDAPDLPEDGDTVVKDILETTDADAAESQDGSDVFASDIDVEHDLSDIGTDEGGSTDVGPECDGSPKEGCPCDKATDEPCCLYQSVGLTCEKVINPPAYYWVTLYDCGCDPGPWCEGYTLFPLCK